MKCRSYISLCILFLLGGGYLSAQEQPTEDNEIDLKTEEVVVVAYGTDKLKSLTGSASYLKSDKLRSHSITSVTSALIGNVSGVQSTLADGQPGSTPSLRIRGFGSVNSSNEPLYVVDGMIYSGSISNINPQDVESIAVLKDAASTALYGSSAGNGVVLITTKRASALKQNQITLQISQGFSQRGIKDYKRVGIDDYYPLQWEMLRNQYIYGSGQDATTAAQNASDNLYNLLGQFNVYKGVANNEIVLTDGRLNPTATTLLYDDFDWAGMAFRNGYRGSYTLSYSTKTTTSDTYASFNYLDENGSMIETVYKRYTGRVNYRIYPTKWFESGINLSVGYTDAKIPMTSMTFTTAKGNMANFVRRMAPIYPVYLHNEDGSFRTDEVGNKLYDYTSNRVSYSGRHTIAEAELNKRGYTRNNYIGNAFVSLTPLEGLQLRLNGALESSNDRMQVYYNTVVADGAPSGRIQVTNERFFSYNFSQLINYQKQLGDNQIEVMLGHENFDFSYNYQYVYKQKQIMNGIYELDNFSILSKLTSRKDVYRKEGYFARANYNYRNTYYFSGSFRRDGSSRFEKSSRWGNFWSVGASWRLEQEKFLKNLEFINLLKLRGSYGETGNDGVLSGGAQNYYPWQTLYNTGVNNSEEEGLYFSVFGNSNLKWETQRSWDMALEFMLFSRLTGTIEYFYKTSNDLLFNVPSALSNGITSVWKNLGKVSNKGLEFTITYDYLDHKDWQGSIGFNGTYLRNRVNKMPDGLPEIVSNTMKIEEGHSIYDFYLRDYQGVNPENGDAIYTLDESKSSTSQKSIVEIGGKRFTSDPNAASYHYCGSSVPKFYGGFNTHLRYRDFSLSLQFSYGIGSKIYDASYAELMGNQMGFAMHQDMKKAWRNPGDITTVPRIDGSQNTRFGVVSDRFLVNGNYLVFQNAALNYSVPSIFLQKIYLEQMTLTLSGENLVQWNHRTGINSLANFNGYTYNLYVPARVFTFTINLTL